MTIELISEKTPNVLIKNDVFYIKDDSKFEKMRIAGATYLIDGQAVQLAHRFTMQHATSLALANLSGYSLWLLTGQSSWQPKSRIIEHQKLWGSFKARGLDIPSAVHNEYFVKTNNQIRYFGIIEVGADSIELALDILESEHISHLVALHPQYFSLMDSIARRGWELPIFGPNIEILYAICRANGVLFWPIGSFDDKIAGTVILSVPSIIDKFVV